MADIKISQLSEFTGDPSGSWLLLNNSDETQTYKSRRETVLAGMVSGSSQIVDLGFVLTSSFNVFTDSYNTASFKGSLDGNATTSTTSQTASYVQTAQTASFVATSSWSSNAITASYVQTAQTASYVQSSSYATTSSYARTASYSLNTISASYAATASYAPLYLPLTGGTITGSLTVLNDLTVLGSASIVYITQSKLDIATNIITVNSNIPVVRFGGIAVIDSGSSPQRSGSLLFDSQQDQWVYVHQNQNVVTSSLLIMGPETYGNVGNETHPTTNAIMKSVNDEHIGDSNITDDGSVVSINSKTVITGSVTSTQGFTGSLQGTSSWSSNAVTASYVRNAVSASFTTTASYALVTTTSASYASTASFMPTSNLLPLITGSLYLKDMVDVTDYNAPSIIDGYLLTWNSGSQLWTTAPGAALKGVIRLFVSANRNNAGAFYFTSITVTADSKASPDANTAFMVTTALLSKVTLYLREDASGTNSVRVDVTKNADGTPFANATSSIANATNTLSQNTTSTYTFSGLTLNQFDSIHIKVTPTSSPGQMYGIITIE